MLSISCVLKQKYIQGQQGGKKTHIEKGQGGNKKELGHVKKTKAGASCRTLGSPRTIQTL
jgi:hypothetical protein